MAELHDAVLYSEIGVGREGKGRESFIIPGKERGGFRHARSLEWMMTRVQTPFLLGWR